MEANLQEFEFLFEDCLVAFENGPKSYQELVDLLPAAAPNSSVKLHCYYRCKDTGLFPVQDEPSFQRALLLGGQKVTFLLRHEYEN